MFGLAKHAPCAVCKKLGHTQDMAHLSDNDMLKFQGVPLEGEQYIMIWVHPECLHIVPCDCKSGWTRLGTRAWEKHAKV